MKCIQRPIRGILTLLYLMIIIVTLLTPKNICQNINFSILDVNSTNMFTSTEIDVLIQDQLSSYNMTFSIKSNKYTTTFEGLDHLNTVFSDSNVDVIIATSPYEFINILSDFANQYDKLLVVNNNNFPLLDDSRTMFMHSGFKLVSSAMTEFLEWFQWANIAVIVTEEAYWQHMAVSLENDLLKNGFRIKHSKKISNFTDPSLFSHLLNDITADEKAIILAMEHTDIGLILPEINKWNEMDKHSFFLLSRDPYRSIDYITSTFINLPNVSRVLESVFVILPIVPNVFLTEIPSTLNESYSDISSIIAQGYHQSFSSTGQQFDSDMVTQQIKSSIFVNKNRTTKFVCLEERCLDFGLYDYDSETHSFKFTRFLRNINNGIWSRTVLKDISWPGDNILYPDECFPDPTCHIDSGINIVTVIVSALGSVAIVVLLALLGVYLWKRHAERFMTKGPNKIVLQLTDVTFLHRKELKSAKTDLSSQRGVFVDKPDLVKGSEKANNRSMVSLHELSEFSEIGRYKGDTVYIKEISSKGFEMSGKMLSHLRTLREIRHENINPMYGVLIDPTCTAVVTEYCNRGSLQDVIKSDHIKLDWDFKISLLTDLVRGLRFLQNSPIRYHGNMKSANCVIDSRWVLKLTNFGLKEKIKVTVQLEPADLLWTAPEHLREQYPGSKGSEKGDMYSFAIISQELILRLSPFGMTELKPHEIIKKLTKPPPLLRPSVSPQAAPPQYIQLMKSCWAENPDMRPSIEEVYHQYKIISGGKKLNIVDSMFRMLEKYSNDLEDIVKERTMELEEEKKKTDLLLFRMLPATVAESLKIGRSIEAEMFTEVTIYFSDIVGFTTISAMSTPMQVVDLLNDLYTMFDATIDIYDVYKVETIGDAYMVASGLPLRNGNRHAGEIGTMALDLLSQCGTFKIRHMPEVPMRVRIGLHSGSCVAGVVGLTMPRYCLFGDTVNTASRMESTGAAFRIHISSQTKTRLDELGSYKIQYRGEVELKGKGMAKTYWLIGKEEFKKPLPEPPPIDSLDSVMQTNDENSVKTGDEPATSSIQQNNSNGPSKFRKQSKQNNMSHTVHQNGKEALQNGSAIDSLIKSDKNERLVRKLTKGESLDEQISLFCNAHDAASFKSSASDSSITTKASVISVDSVVSSSDCELRVLKSPKTPIDENSSHLSPVSEV